MTFEEMYKRILKASIVGKDKEEVDKLLNDGANKKQLDCLLNPENSAVVWHVGEAVDEEKCSCLFNAITKKDDGSLTISKEKCVGCGACIDDSKTKKIIASKDVIPALNAIKNKKNLVYALVAPAFYGQFSRKVTPGKFRSALKKIGFDGMIEVALFADILTLKESLEFDKNINDEKDFQLTSCCCPMWIAMIKKVYKELVPHLPASVSPMIASGRTVKFLHPDCTTIFIGPCLAKKAEAREKDLVGAVDFVLTFQEINDVFEAMEIDLESLPDNEKNHSSRCGRIYARAGGVSEAVKSTVDRLNPNRKISVKTEKADGVLACKKLLNNILSGNTSANFFEGMGCIGGCVGGPKVMINRDEGKETVDEYGDSAKYLTPIDNPYVIELLKRLGFKTVEELLEKSDIFTRDL